MEIGASNSCHNSAKGCQNCCRTSIYYELTPVRKSWSSRT